MYSWVHIDCNSKLLFVTTRVTRCLGHRLNLILPHVFIIIREKYEKRKKGKGKGKEKGMEANGLGTEYGSVIGRYN